MLQAQLALLNAVFVQGQQGSIALILEKGRYQTSE